MLHQLPAVSQRSAALCAGVSNLLKADPAVPQRYNSYPAVSQRSANHFAGDYFLFEFRPAVTQRCLTFPSALLSSAIPSAGDLVHSPAAEQRSAVPLAEV